MFEETNRMDDLENNIYYTPPTKKRQLSNVEKKIKNAISCKNSPPFYTRTINYFILVSIFFLNYFFGRCDFKSDVWVNHNIAYQNQSNQTSLVSNNFVLRRKTWRTGNLNEN